MKASTLADIRVELTRLADQVSAIRPVHVSINTDPIADLADAVRDEAIERMVGAHAKRIREIVATMIDAGGYSSITDTLIRDLLPLLGWDTEDLYKHRGQFVERLKAERRKP